MFVFKMRITKEIKKKKRFSRFNLNECKFMSQTREKSMEVGYKTFIIIIIII